MIVQFKELTLQNFKSHQDLKVNFGEVTQITGDNAKGKSSIGEAITFLLYGTDLYGGKMDPTPITYETDSTKVELLFEVDGQETLLGREIAKGRNKYYVDEVPSKATEFNLVIEQFFDKELFLALFNPNYFFTLHWEKQRAMILQYITPPANKEVFAELPKPQTDKLAELVKKHSLDDLEAIHRENKRNKEKEHIAAQSRTKTLKEQLEQVEYVPPKSTLNTLISQLKSKLKEKKLLIEKANEKNNKIRRLQQEIEFLTQNIENGRNEHTELKTKEIDTSCYACGQELQNDAIEKVLKKKEEDLRKIANRVNPLIQKRKELREKLLHLEAVKVDEELIQEVEGIEKEILEHERNLLEHDRIERLDKEIAEAEKDEIEIKKSLTESIFIIDAIKDFRAKEAELQAKKVQDLFETLSIRLFDEVKSTGELKPTFVIQEDGKDYNKLSLSETIRAGLEVRDVLSEQSGLIVPVFVDNAESITKFKEPIGQLIMAKVVANKELEVIANGSDKKDV